MGFTVRVAVIATGVGNVRSVVRAVAHTASHTRGSSAEVVATRDPDVVRRADVLVVPGQGSFGAHGLDDLREPMLEQIRRGAPYLGICLGLQILFEESEEAPGTRGLAVLRGRVERLRPDVDPETSRPRPLPHVGWNRAELTGPAANPARAVIAPAHYYFAHSYAAVPADPSVTVATTTYGSSFTSAVTRDNVVGVQFHPEKSQRAGLALLERFFAAVQRAP
jgi:glutamine amidotransferase